MRTTLVLLGLVVAFATAQTCTKINQVSENGNCDFTTNICAGELVCVSGKCKFPPLEGATCTTDPDCQNNQPYYNLFCSSGKCTRKFKNAGESCAVAGECASNTCTSGSCVALAAGASCTTNKLCGSATNALFCNTNGTCQATIASGGQCGNIGGTFVQCVPGLVCVGSTSTATTGTCNALSTTAGTACAGFASGPLYPAAVCSAAANLACLASSGSSTGSACTKLTFLAAGAKCDSTAPAGSICDPLSASCVNGTCLAYSAISCTTANTGICGSFANCNCPDASKAGTCQVQTGLSQTCIDRTKGLVDCSNTINTQNSLSICGGVYKSARCCLKNNGYGPNNADLTAAYCSSATKASFAFAVLIAMIVMML